MVSIGSIRLRKKPKLNPRLQRHGWKLTWHGRKPINALIKIINLMDTASNPVVFKAKFIPGAKS
jgi:hypothetical protein